MMSTLLFVFSALAGSAIASETTGNLHHRALDTSSPCQPLHAFLARGNNEPYPGRQGTLVKAICSGLSGCDYEDIQFNNPLESPYCAAVAEGAGNGIAQITAYNKRCPDSKLVLAGYSQGAHVIGDILGGGGGVFFQGCVQPPNAGLNPKTTPGSKIAAVVTFGNTRHTANQAYNFESGAGNPGLFPRPADQLANLNGFASVWRDYCVSGDPICAGGKDGPSHLSYFSIFSDSAAAWVKKTVGETPAPVVLPASTTTLVKATASVLVPDVTGGVPVGGVSPTASGVKEGDTVKPTASPVVPGGSKAEAGTNPPASQSTPSAAVRMERQRVSLVLSIILVALMTLS